jgi:hypothetical protein
VATKKPSSPEGEYIARDEAKRRELAAIRRHQAEAAAAREARLRTCPGGCETKLVDEAHRDVVIHRCPTCRGVWLDPGELEKISHDEAPVVRDFLRFFQGKGA